jgi:hypothetical protein
VLRSVHRHAEAAEDDAEVHRIDDAVTVEVADRVASDAFT